MLPWAKSVKTCNHSSQWKTKNIHIAQFPHGAYIEKFTIYKGREAFLKDYYLTGPAPFMSEGIWKQTPNNTISQPYCLILNCKNTS